MKEFGYTLSKSSRIDLDKADRSFYITVAEKEPSIKSCIRCGSCAASCTASVFTRVSFRSAIVLLGRGLEREALPLLKSCMLCGKCIMVCPRGIDTRNAIINIIKKEEETR